jgi:hypothetical protein
MRASILLAGPIAALLACGCFTPMIRRPPTAAPQPATPRTRAPGERADSTGLPGGIARKVVHGKRDPNLLIAIDGDLCTVSEQRYRDTQYGDRVWCAWRAAGTDR